MARLNEFNPKMVVAVGMGIFPPALLRNIVMFCFMDQWPQLVVVMEVISFVLDHVKDLAQGLMLMQVFRRQQGGNSITFSSPKNGPNIGPKNGLR